MVKKRIIPVQLLLDDSLVKTVCFDQYRHVGQPVASSRVYNSQYVDELVFLNINRGNRTSDSLLELIERVSEVSFVPLAFGGGIRSLADATALLKNGADKVVINSITFDDPGIIARIGERFGSQAVMVSIDVRHDPATNSYRVYSNCGRDLQAISLKDHIETVIEQGAGELLINSIDRDGTMVGYDLELIKFTMEHSSVPVIACGGAGSFDHLHAAFLETGVHAVACGSLFYFGDNNPIRAKAFLSNHGVALKQV